MNILLTEDDAAPDSKNAFYRDFEKLMGIAFPVWRKSAELIENNDTITVEDDTHGVTMSIGDLHWKLYQK